MKRHLTIRTILRLTALMLALLMLPVTAAYAESAEDEWVTFLLLCNEGMTNEGGNTGNTIMAVSMHPETGNIRLMMITWDTFVQYEGYDIPQLISTPYRNAGPEGTLEVFNNNFDMNIKHYISLNYLNLAQLIDNYGGVDVDITRAERNALNGMVSSKKWSLEQQADSGLLTEMVIEMLAQEYYLEEYGPNTHLNGLQAVGFGWLQYDSVYNCCERDVQVNADLFERVAQKILQSVEFVDAGTRGETPADDRRIINVDDMTEEDIEFLIRLVHPIFEKSVNNMTETEIRDISVTLARVAYSASRQGVDIFESLDHAIFPLEAKKEYDLVAGVRGHLVDYEANSEAMKEFLFTE